ncbi:Flp pilus assembly complex ATPase component TadA [Candidatus Sumerlaeota bacterium]|nr:Flp pilus assembly complex ATPase component TadA [Candidatus Sumerlaeota bacterium]
MKIKQLLQEMVRLGGTDLHIMAGMRPAIRVQRQLIPVQQSLDLSAEDAREIIYEMLTPEQIEMFESDPEHRNDMNIALSVPQLGRYRMNLYRQRGTTAVSIRSLPMEVPTLESCNLPPVAEEFVQARRGLALITGPARSGKSTTLAALINEINELRALHIITIENPIEYLHNCRKSYVSQREVGRNGDTRSFKLALESAMHQDPDIIQLGNLDDFDLAEMALTAADSGVLVFATLSTVSVAQTLSRIVDIFPQEKHQQVLTSLADNLVGVISHMLLPRAGEAGYVLAAEVLRANTMARDAIRHNRLEGIYPTLSQSMDDAFIDLARKKMVDYETVAPYIRSDSTHRKIQTLLGVSRPITSFTGNLTPLPIEPPGATSGVHARPGSSPNVYNRSGSSPNVQTRPPSSPDVRSRPASSPDVRVRPGTPPKPAMDPAPEPTPAKKPAPAWPDGASHEAGHYTPSGRYVIPPWEKNRKPSS